jgi:hypothetical protein
MARKAHIHEDSEQTPDETLAVLVRLLAKRAAQRDHNALPPRASTPAASPGADAASETED